MANTLLWNKSAISVIKRFVHKNIIMDVKECVRRLENLAPRSLAASFDNVGLLIQPPHVKTVRKMLLTNDLTEMVLREAENLKVDFILSYHPPIFEGMKRITDNTWKERIVAKCLAGGIAVFSPHTSFDALSGGVNDWLISAFGMGTVAPIEQAYESSKWDYEVQICTDDAQSGSKLADQITFTFESKVLCRDDGKCNLTILCEKDCLSQVIYLVKQGEEIIEESLAVVELLSKIPIYNFGMGRLSELSSPLTVSEAVNRVKGHLSLTHVRLAIKQGGNPDSVIHSVAVCAGAGSSVLNGVKADLYLTGEMRHHEILEATHNGTSIILTDHSNSERGFLKLLKPRLAVLFENSVEIVVASCDTDPLNVV